jgi:RNA polymerase sigma factor (sigma-70 family)
MEAESLGSVSHWIEGLRKGDSVAAQELWNRYFSQLVRVAQARLRSISREVSGEDVALSALKSVMIGVQNDRFPELTDRTSLWPLLVTITARKAITELRRKLAQKRAVSMEVSLTEIRDYVGLEPTPEFAVEVADELECLVVRFGDPTLRLIAQRKLEGSTHDDIANELGVSRKTVIRKLNRIRQEWLEAETDGSSTTVE